MLCDDEIFRAGVNDRAMPRVVTSRMFQVPVLIR